MTLIEEFLDNIESLKSVNYGTTDELQKHNSAVDRCREIAKTIERDHPELKMDFCNLLTSDDIQIRKWVAHHMLEVMNYPQEQKKLALDEIRNIIQQNIHVESLGNNILLKTWYAEHPEDKLL